MINIKLSSRVQAIKPSPTLAVSKRAAELKATGLDIIDLGAGEPDFDTPDYIKEAAIEAIKRGQTKYTAVDGTPGLKKAIIAKLANENNLHYLPNQILVSCGAKHSLYNLFQALLNSGDEVIIPAPYWVSYPDMALLSDAVPVTIETDISSKFKITADQLAEKINSKTRLLVINSPSNPSGMAYSRKELESIAAVLLKHPNVMIVSDDIYEHILWRSEPFINIINVCPELYDRTIVVNGVSKAYAMTGWRIGYAAGPAVLIAAMAKIQSQSTSNPSSISQSAAQAALEMPPKDLPHMVKAFKHRHDFLYTSLNKLEGFECIPADGTFYAYPYIQKAMDKLGMQTDIQFSEFLLDQARVALVPGSAFGTPGYIRMSYATSQESLSKAVARIADAIMTTNKADYV